MEFSDTEQEYIDSLKTVKVGYLRNMAPFQYYERGSFHGVLKDIMDIVADELGVKVEEKGYDNTQKLVKSDSKSSNDALKGTMAQIMGENYTDLQTDVSDIKETNTIMESLDAIENLKADFTVSDYYSVYYYTERRHFSAFAGSAVFLHISRS